MTTIFAGPRKSPRHRRLDTPRKPAEGKANPALLVTSNPVVVSRSPLPRSRSVRPSQQVTPAAWRDGSSIAPGRSSRYGGISTENQNSLVLSRVSNDVVGTAVSRATKTLACSGETAESNCSHTLIGKAVPALASKWPSCQTSAVADRSTNTAGNTNVPSRLSVLSMAVFTNAMRPDLMFDTLRSG